MRAVMYLAWCYLRWHRWKTLILTVAVTLVLYLPLGLQLVVEQTATDMTARADATPLVLGGRGSPLELVLNSLYFSLERPARVNYEELERLQHDELVDPVPLYVRFHSQTVPIVGTSLDYFGFRRLSIARGRQMQRLGEAVLGVGAAEQLGVAVGDAVISSPESLFDIAGVYPLKMNVVGILERTHTSDDLGIFVDLKTAWIIEGLGHGHQDVTQLDDPTLIYEQTENNVSATPKLMHYSEITDINLDSFHFHGDLTRYPLTAVLVFPNNTKSETLLRGRYLSQDERHQIIKPTEVIDGLLQNIFRIKNVLEAVIAVVGSATFLAMILVFALSLRLRQREIQTIFKLGCRKDTIARLLGAEIGMILIASLVLCALLVSLLARVDQGLVRVLFIQ